MGHPPGCPIFLLLKIILLLPQNCPSADSRTGQFFYMLFPESEW